MRRLERLADALERNGHHVVGFSFPETAADLRRLLALEDEVRRVVNCPRGDCDCPCRSWTTWVLKQLKEALP